jgi:dihydrodipicolinate reductase
LAFPADSEARENGVFMKIILIGANGKIGELVQKALAGASHEIVKDVLWTGIHDY